MKRQAKATIIFLLLTALRLPALAEMPQSLQYPANLHFEFVQIRAGRFWMGCPLFDVECYRDEWPQHPVRFKEDFEIGKYLVTQAMWNSVMGNNPSYFQGADRPVEMVSWSDVQGFLTRLNARNDGYHYRLPTEAEWEYAARAGSTAARYGELQAIAWYDGDSRSKTHPIGEKRPNAWGLFDMLGNVNEWVQDWYGEDYYRYSPRKDPQGPSSGTERSLRGGSWLYVAAGARVSYRSSAAPSNRTNDIGFRCVRTPINDKPAGNAPK